MMKILKSILATTFFATKVLGSELVSQGNITVLPEFLEQVLNPDILESRDLSALKRESFQENLSPDCVKKIFKNPKVTEIPRDFLFNIQIIRILRPVIHYNKFGHLDENSRKKVEALYSFWDNPTMGVLNKNYNAIKYSGTSQDINDFTAFESLCIATNKKFGRFDRNKAALRLKGLGEEYYPKFADALYSIATDLGVDIADRRIAVNELKNLGPAYHQKAAQACLTIINHYPNGFHLYTALILKDCGTEHHPKVIETLISVMRNVTWDIRYRVEAASHLLNLAPEHHSQCITFLHSVIDDTTVSDHLRSMVEDLLIQIEVESDQN